jgi:NifU-like protein involved in Fe-S cluster formation
MESFQGEATKHNRNCGDVCHMRLSWVPLKVSYEVQGCSLHLASTEVAAEMCSGLPRAEASELVSKVIGHLERNEGCFDDPRLLALFEIKSHPVRRKCVLLAWQTLFEALGSGHG